jgi:putative methyltransferase
LLVHDYLLAKKGIAAPSKHPLKLAIERHKARLGAELTKARIRRQCGTIESLRQLVEHGISNSSYQDGIKPTALGEGAIIPKSHPRWIRVNTIRTTLEHQLATTFKGFRQVGDISDLFESQEDRGLRLFVDQHIPNLIAVHPRSDFTKSNAYTKGEIIFQDKASCFPAYLLDPKVTDASIIDSCAAPGNKTSHITALFQQTYDYKGLKRSPPCVLAVERDQGRASILKRMMIKAGVPDRVNIFPGQDFLQVNYDGEPWTNATAVLVDPSCSGSGMIGGDDIYKLELPSSRSGQYRKSQRKEDTSKAIAISDDVEAENVVDATNGVETQRLAALSAFQLKLLLHAFRFPSVSRVVYSTCSIYPEENENVVCNALLSSEAQDRGWKILAREHQVSGLKYWNVRGDLGVCKEAIGEDIIATKVADACICCSKLDGQGTMGFFVAGFVRDMPNTDSNPPTDDVLGDDSEWDGCDDELKVTDRL